MQKGAQVDSKDNVSILFVLRYLEKSIIFTILACDIVKYHEFVVLHFNECVARVEML